MTRPKSSRWIDADEAIGHACAQLMHWGYPGHQVFSAVSAAADRAFGRSVGPERVRQVYRYWAEQARPLGYPDPGAFTKASRAKHQPGEPIQTLAERLLCEHRPGALEKRARQREMLAEIERRAGQVNDRQTPPRPNPLDDPRWFAVGAGTHPDDMNAEQRAAFEALPPEAQAKYLALIKEDATDAEKDEGKTRERWEQFGPHVDAAFELLRAELTDGVYAPPGVGGDLDTTPIRGRRRRKRIG